MLMDPSDSEFYITPISVAQLNGSYEGKAVPLHAIEALGGEKV
jgi:hypothetical protein